MPGPAAEYPPLRRLFSLELIPLGAHPIDVGEHPLKQGFGRGRGYPSPLKLPDFATLAVDLDAHPFDFGAKLVKLHGIFVPPKPFQSGAAQPSSGGLPCPEAASGSTA